MVIGIDIDDTLTETSLKAAECLKKYDSTYDDYHDLPLERYEEFMRLYIDNILGTENLKENVQDAFLYLNEHGYQIIIITARNNKYSDKTKQITLDYLKKNNLKYNQIIFDQDKKGFEAKKNNIKIFIDDKETVLDDVATYGIECIHIGNKKSKYKSFTNWKDIIEYLKMKEG